MHGLTSDTRTAACRLMLSLYEEDYNFLITYPVKKCQEMKKKKGQTKMSQAELKSDFGVSVIFS